MVPILGNSTRAILSEGELVLRSLNAVTKDTPIVTSGFGRPSPDPGPGSPIELGHGHTGHLLDLSGIGEALSSQSIAEEESPPALLQIQPARSLGNEDMQEARMVSKPGARFQARACLQIITKA